MASTFSIVDVGVYSWCGEGMWVNGPLTLGEQTAAISLGLAVTVCESCGLPTLYHALTRPPKTCGRVPCMQTAGEHLRYRRRE